MLGKCQESNGGGCSNNDSGRINDSVTDSDSDGENEIHKYSETENSYKIGSGIDGGKHEESEKDNDSDSDGVTDKINYISWITNRVR